MRQVRNEWHGNVLSICNLEGRVVLEVTVPAEEIEECMRYSWRMEGTGYAVTGRGRCVLYLHKLLAKKGCTWRSAPIRGLKRMIIEREVILDENPS